jgi:hypothetical protein
MSGLESVDYRCIERRHRGLFLELHWRKKKERSRKILIRCSCSNSSRLYYLPVKLGGVR